MRQLSNELKATRKCKPKTFGKGEVRITVVLVLGFVAVLIGGLFLVMRSSRIVDAPVSDQAPLAASDSQPSVSRLPEDPQILSKGRERDRSIGRVQEQPVFATASSPEAEQAVSRISQLDPSRPLSQEQVAALKQDLKSLVAQGAGAVPAVLQILKEDRDLKFDAATSQELGSRSLRSALIDTLRQIDAPEAMTASHQVLTGTVDPLEVAQLARSLEEKAPGQYRQDELAAARNSLELAAGGQLKGQDISPLFEMFHAFGDQTSVDQMKQIAERGKWINYLPYIMAEMPDGVGVSALTELASNPALMAKDQQSAVLRSLTVAAVSYPDAATALSDRARQGQITDAAWSRIAGALGGDSYRPYTPTVFGGDTAQGATLSADTIAKRLALIDQLTGAISSQPARDALNQARARLTSAVPGH